MASIMTALWFAHLRAPDRVSVKPHASPVLHAINYLLGELDAKYLTTLRELGGLQSYPSRTKDPDPVDFSTGSVGIGATATIWSALAHRYVAGHVDVAGRRPPDRAARRRRARRGRDLGGARRSRRRLARRGACGSSTSTASRSTASSPRWRRRLQGMFEAAGWQVLTVKYGRRLEELFARPGGEALRAASTRCPTRSTSACCAPTAAELRERLPGDAQAARHRAGGRRLDDDELRHAVRDLGGHDLAALLDAYRAADARATAERRLRLHDQGLVGCRPRATRPTTRRCSPPSSTRRSPPSSAPTPPTRGRRSPRTPRRRELCARGRSAAARAGAPRRSRPRCPPTLGREHRGRGVDPAGASAASSPTSPTRRPRTAERVVTVEPDVASSTNLGGWINSVGIWSVGERIDWFADDPETLVPLARERPRPAHRARHRRDEPRRAAGRAGRHLDARRRAAAADRHDLRPVRRPRPRAVVVRDLRRRAVDPRRHAVGRDARARGRRAPVDHHAEDRHRAAGLHRVGAGVRPGPRVDVLDALSRLGPPGGTSGYFRLSTRPIDQALAAPPADAAPAPGRGARRRLPPARGDRAPRSTLAAWARSMPEVMRGRADARADAGHAPTSSA